MFFFKLISNCCISFHSWAIIDNAMELRLLLPVAPCHLVLLLGHLLRSLGPRRAQLVDVVPIGAAPWSKTVSITRWRPYRQPLLTNTYTLLIKRYESYIFYNLLYLLWTLRSTLLTRHAWGLELQRLLELAPLAREAFAASELTRRCYLLLSWLRLNIYDLATFLPAR